MFFNSNCLKFQVVEMTRLIEVSHWGNVAVEESFTIKHVGALLKVKSYFHFVLAFLLRIAFLLQFFKCLYKQ